MDELLIEKDKKTEWIKKFGGDEGLAFLNTIVKELEADNTLIQKSEEVVADAEVVKDEVVAEVKDETIVKEATTTLVGSTSIDTILKQYTTDVVQPLYDSLYALQEYVRTLESKNAELQITLQTVLAQISGVSNYVKSFAVVETTPSASYRSLLNQPTQLTPVFGSPVMKDDPILKEKIVESKNVVVKENTPFSGFMQGL